MKIEVVASQLDNLYHVLIHHVHVKGAVHVTLFKDDENSLFHVLEFSTDVLGNGTSVINSASGLLRGLVEHFRQDWDFVLYDYYVLFNSLEKSPHFPSKFSLRTGEFTSIEEKYHHEPFKTLVL